MGMMDQQPKDLREEWKIEQKKVDPVAKVKEEIRKELKAEAFIDAQEEEELKNTPKSPYDDINDVFEEETNRGNVAMENIVKQKDTDDNDAILHEEHPVDLDEENNIEKGMN